MQILNPYQKNSEILKDFFQKPITLVVAITFTVHFFFSFIFKGGIDVNDILWAVPFYILYFSSKSKDNYVNFLPMSKYISRVATIYYILCIVVFSIFLFFAIAMVCFEYDKIPEDTIIIVKMLSFLDFMILFVLLHYIAFAKFGKAIRVSASTVYLSRKGVKFFAIITFLCAIFVVVAGIVRKMYIVDFYNQIVNLCKNFMDFPIDNITIPDKDIGIKEYILSALDFLKFVFIGIFALMYDKHIKNISDTLYMTPDIKFYGGGNEENSVNLEETEI